MPLKPPRTTVLTGLVPKAPAMALALGALVSLFGAPAFAKDAPARPVSDPLRPMNLAVFRLNEKALDPYLIKPAVRVHNKAVPKPARISIRHFLFNLGEPVNIENALLQGNFRQAARSTGRFGLNTTVGLLGLMDPAAGLGLAPHKEDFGQTLAVYGVGHGPYLVLPVLGSSSARDLTGRIVDGLIDPFSLITFQNDVYVDVAKRGLEELQERASDVKDDLRAGTFASLPLEQHYDLDRRDFRVAQVAAINNEPTRIAASATYSASPDPVFTAAPPQETKTRTAMSLEAALKDLGLRETDRTGETGMLEVTVKSDSGAGPLPCRQIWPAIDTANYADLRSITITSDAKSGPVHSCTKIL